MRIKPKEIQRKNGEDEDEIKEKKRTMSFLPPSEASRMKRIHRLQFKSVPARNR